MSKARRSSHDIWTAITFFKRMIHNVYDLNCRYNQTLRNNKTNMAETELDLLASMSEDDMAGDGDGSEDIQMSNYGTRSDPELDSDSEGELTATM